MDVENAAIALPLNITRALGEDEQAEIRRLIRYIESQAVLYDSLYLYRVRSISTTKNTHVLGGGLAFIDGLDGGKAQKALLQLPLEKNIAKKVEEVIVNTKGVYLGLVVIRNGALYLYDDYLYKKVTYIKELL